MAGRHRGIIHTLQVLSVLGKQKTAAHPKPRSRRGADSASTAIICYNLKDIWWLLRAFSKAVEGFQYLVPSSCSYKA